MHDIDFFPSFLQKLKKSFAAITLPKNDGPIKIIDDKGKSWPCYLMHHTGDPLCSSIVRGWSDFCSENRLIQGNLVKFGVKNYHSCSLYYLV